MENKIFFKQRKLERPSYELSRSLNRYNRPAYPWYLQDPPVWMWAIVLFTLFLNLV